MSKAPTSNPRHRAPEGPLNPLELTRRVAYLLGPRGWRKMWGLLALSLLASVLEVLGIGIFLPYIAAVRDPQGVLDHDRFGPILRSLGIVDPSVLVVGAGLALVCVFTAKNGYLAFQWWLVTRLVFRETRRFSARLFSDYLASPYLFHTQRNSATMVRNVAAEARHVFIDVLEQGIRVLVEALVFLGLLVVLFVVNPLGALLGLLFLGVLAWGLDRITRRRVGHLGSRRAKAVAHRFQWVQQGLGAIKEIQILGRADYFVRKFDDWGKVETEAMRNGRLASKYPQLAIEMAAVLLLVGLITTPLLAGQPLDAILGMLVIFAVAVVRLLPAVRKITQGVNKVRFSAVSVDILYDELTELERASNERRRRETGAPVAFEESIHVERVSYRYPERSDWAVREVDVTIRRGESIGFSGPSGGGKTTLLNMLVGLLDPTEGRILVDGQDIARNVGSWQRQIGYVSQDLYLLDDSVRRNVAFGIPDEKIDDSAIWRALEGAQLARTVEDMGDGLDTRVGERGVALSGGQRQRLAIARALYHDPPVLVLDEPTSALDRDTEAQIEQTITSLSEAKTVLIVSHREETLRNCDAIYVLEGGRLAELERPGQTEPQLRLP